MADNTRDTVRRRLQRLVLAVVLLVIVVGCVSVGSVMLATANVVRLTSGYGPANDANAQALTAMLDAEAAVRTFQTTHQATELNELQRAASGVRTSLADL